MSKQTDKRRLVKTTASGKPIKEPGIFRRVGGEFSKPYVAIFYSGGKQQREYARTLAEAKKVKAARVGDVARGEFFAASRLRFKDYATEWVERYQGRGHGFRESTRTNYKADLNRAYQHLGSRRLSEIEPRDLANYVAWLMDERAQGKALADSTIANCMKPVRACLASAVDEGLLRVNPAANVRLPKRPKVEDEDDEDEGADARAFTREQLATLLELAHPKHRLLFRFLSVTGLRISELIALEWRHLELEGDRPHVKVRRQRYRGEITAPKTKYGKRNVRIPTSMATELRQRRAQSGWDGDADLVFPNETGKPHHVENLRRRHLRPILGEVGADWASFHSFRHTCASLLFERGRNAVQVQRWLGHHSPAFTLSKYVHLIRDDPGDPLDLADELRVPLGSTLGSTSDSESQRNEEAAALGELA
jgi:integrase